MSLQFTPIGTIYSPFDNLEGMPIQPAGAKGLSGRVEVFPQYAEGLKDLEGFSHLILLYHFHKSQGFKLLVTPFLDTEERGVFSTRAPRRPNPIGISIVELTGREGNVLHIRNVDILNGTPLLDIKPYAPAFDHQDACRTGWLEKAQERASQIRSDSRFKE